MASRKNPEHGCLTNATTDFSTLPNAEIGECLTQIARVARDSSIEIYLVGGMVRDLVSGRNTLSASPDLTVLGEAIEFARNLTEAIQNCALVSTSQHNTAEVIIGSTPIDNTMANHGCSNSINGHCLEKPTQSDSSSPCASNVPGHAWLRPLLKQTHVPHTDLGPSQYFTSFSGCV